MSDEKVEESPKFAGMLLKIQNNEQFKKAVDALVRFRNHIPSEDKAEITKLINDNFLRPIGDQKEAEGLKEQAEYIRSKIN